MALSDQQSIATNIVSFGSQSGPSVLNYNISLPGSVSGRRIVRLEMPDSIMDADYTSPGDAPVVGAPYHLTAHANGTWSYKPNEALVGFFKIIDQGIDAKDSVFKNVAEAMKQSLQNVNSSATTKLIPAKDGKLLVQTYTALAAIDPSFNERKVSTDVRNAISNIVGWYEQFLEGLDHGYYGVLNRSGSSYKFATAASSAVATKFDPAFYLVENYSVSSYLGDYGLGKTLNTFSLLPGEETKIYMKSWRTDTVTTKLATSVVDSYTSEAEDSLRSDIKDETTTKDAQADKTEWQVKAQAEVSWGVFKGKVEGGASGSHQASRDTFAGHVENAVKQHAFKASSNRSNSVSSESTATSTTGTENTTERVIKNVNLRRVLNFVFRELNQQYTCKTTLTNIKVAYFSGSGVWDEVDLVNLRDMLERNLTNDAAVDTVARLILRLASVSVDHEGTPQKLIDRLSFNEDGSFTKSEIAVVHGNIVPPDKARTFTYQFKRGPIGQSTKTIKADGHLVREFGVTMRTEAIVCEALLGQADALDPYALNSQALDTATRDLGNERTKLALETLRAITDPVERSKAYALMFVPPVAPSTSA